jgi:hypothetical protein
MMAGAGAGAAEHAADSPPRLAGLLPQLGPARPRCHEVGVSPAHACLPAFPGRKQHARALELFLLGLTAPTHVFNAITAAIFKKYALVSIIHQGGWVGC